MSLELVISELTSYLTYRVSCLRVVLLVDVVYQPLIEVDTHTSLYAQCRVRPAGAEEQDI